MRRKSAAVWLDDEARIIASVFREWEDAILGAALIGILSGACVATLLVFVFATLDLRADVRELRAELLATSTLPAQPSRQTAPAVIVVYGDGARVPDGYVEVVY